MPVTINGDGIVTAEGTSTTQGRLRLGEDTDNGTNYVELQAPASVASNVTFTLPSADGTNGQVLQTNGSGALSFTTPAGGFSTAQVFTSSSTFTVPSSGKFQVTICGGGGGGAGSTSTGSGGSSGGTCIKWYTGITPGTSCTVTIGSGGTGQTSGGTAATNGGNSSFSGSGVTTLTANGGAAIGGSGGSASGGDINIAGMPGGIQIIGGSGFNYSGEGGGSFFGPGGTRVGLNVSGRNAQAYGAGGSGGSSYSGVAVDGGNGAGGICIVEY